MRYIITLFMLTTLASSEYIDVNSFPSFNSPYHMTNGTRKDDENRAYRGFCVKSTYLINDMLSKTEDQAMRDTMAFTEGVYGVDSYALNGWDAYHYACREALDLKEKPKDFRKTLFKTIRKNAK